MSQVPQTPPGRPEPWTAGEVAAFHITHIDNIPSMADDGLLVCDSECVTAGVQPVSIAYADLKAKRSTWPVDCAQGGTLADYVPFYYAPRSPMLYVISNGYVASYSGGQVEVAHLVLCVQGIARPGEFVITDGHAATSLSSQYDDLARLDQIDWPVMRGQYWFDTDQHGDRKRRRQAEFLVSAAVPFTAVRQIGVMTETVAEEVRDGLKDAAHQPPVVVRRDWYY